MIPGLGRSPGGGHGNPLQYSCLQNPMNRGTWQATVHRIAKSQTRLKRLSSSSSCPKGASPLAQGLKNLPARAEAVGDPGDAGLIPGLGRSPGGRYGNSLKCSHLQNPMDREAWQATVHRVTQNWTRIKQLSMHGSMIGGTEDKSSSPFPSVS